MENSQTLKEGINKTKELRDDVINFLIPAFMIIAVEIFFALANYMSGNISTFLFILEVPALILECLMVYALYMTFWGITRKTKNATLIIGIILLLISSINLFKIAFTGEPVLLTDILFLNSSDEIIGIINSTFLETIKPYLVPILLETITILLMIILSYRYNKKLNSKKLRINLAIIPLIVLVIIFLPIKTLNTLTLKVFFEIETRADYEANVSNLAYFMRYGTITGMYGQLLENRNMKPEDYNDEVLDLELEKANKEISNKKLGTPNIITVFSESFWDIDQLTEIEFNKTVAPNFKKYKNEGLYFEMISPVYGGISSNVEFEYLTGATTRYFNNGYVPTMQLYTNDKYYENPSIINELKNNGYTTKIVTCASPRLFEFGRFYKYLKIDEKEFVTKVKKEDIKGQYISDEAVTNKIINEFENKEKGQKLFYMLLTLQNHMPYQYEKYEQYDIEIVKSDLSDEINGTIQAYAQGIYDADKQLARLYEYVKNYDEPTIIVFYGDHLPYLSAGREDALKQLEYFNTEDKELNIFRKYNTPALILANFDLEEQDEIKYLSPDLLSTYILNNMDIDISPYYKWLYSTRNVIGAGNSKIIIDQEGKIYNTNKINGDIKRLYNLRKNMQYKFFIK